jgi:hypothetical protein
MLDLFPIGDTPWRLQRTPSRWPEFSFAFDQVAKAIEPTLTLDKMLTNWKPIAEGLAEKPRKRKSQEQTLAKTSWRLCGSAGGSLLA